MGKYDEALKAYDKAIELNPNSNPLWMGKGEIQKLLGHNTESQAAFTKAKELGYAGVIPTPGVVSLELQNSDAA